MLENPMVIDSLWAWKERPELRDHWEEDRTDELVEEYAGDRSIIEGAVAMWLMADRMDADRAYTVYENMPGHYQTEILGEYIAAKNMENDFNIWFEERRHHV